MAAQPGNSILLSYGNQGAQQPGGALLLNYNAPAGTGSTLVGLSTLAPWKKSRTTRKALNATYVADKRLDLPRAAPWVAAETKTDSRRSPWVRTVKSDGAKDSPWPAFGVTNRGEKRSSWPRSARKDDHRGSLWGAFGEMMNEDRAGRWARSAPADAFKRAVLGAFWIPTYVPIPYVRPNGLLANFVVVGGSPIPAWTMPSTEANQYLPIHAQFGAELYTAHFTGDPVRTYWPPAPSAANFLIDENASRQLLVDEFGNAILLPSSRDTFKYNPWGVSKKVDDTTIIPWIKFSRPLNPGWGVVTPGGGITPPAPGESVIIPVKRFYLMVNEIILARADDNTAIPAAQMSISFDCDSWLPSFTATIPESAQESIMPDPTPVEVYAFVNGSEFKFFVEKITRNRQFGSRTVTIAGRGIACELDSPYAAASQHTNGSAMNAQQLIDAALQYTGYTQTWNITDWLVPAGASSVFGTAIDVAAQVAEASGSVLAADWLLRDLRMLPRYPVKPWEWNTATPDYVIPAAVTQSESLEWVERPDYNVVYVSGTEQGVIGQVKRTGTAGDKAAPMVTHPLVTHVDAARQKGISILSDTGRKIVMQRSMPVLPETGVIDICKLVEITEGATSRRGIVRANQINVNFPTVRQTLTIEAAA